MLIRPVPSSPFLAFFFFNDTATTEIYTLSLHDALPISLNFVHGFGTDGKLAAEKASQGLLPYKDHPLVAARVYGWSVIDTRSEEHTSELQSRLHLVCRLLLEKK